MQKYCGLGTYDSFNWRGNLLNKDLVRGSNPQLKPQPRPSPSALGHYCGRVRHSETADYDTGQENDHNLGRCEREEEGIQVPARNLPDGA